MNLFKNKKTKNKDKIKVIENSNQKQEERTPNHWTYNDDPLLNMEPLFSDDPAASKISKNFSSSSNLDNTEVSGDVDISVRNKLEELRKIVGAQKVTPQKREGVLGSIIDRARKNSQDIQTQVLENDPVIAKLLKIENLRKTGGVDEELYTDVEKIKKNTVSYADRAKEFYSKHTSKPVESELERVRRLSQEVQSKREEQKRQSSNFKTNEIIENLNVEKDNRTVKGIFKVPRKLHSYSHIQEITREQELKNKLLEIKKVKFRNIEEEIDLTIQEIDSKKFKDQSKKDQYLDEKLKEFDKLLRDSTKENRKPELELIKPRRTQSKKK
ncbi:hypothetical protein [Spiroplasma cantharicola]|uniref:Uncharacterized protein n=1 Tax=Spiroplasma cantharicola TaxID=362837 RepID=A0A0M4JXE4_9MOLU|nr:hypothetical protein [Spiroplasma cantharicola]ALD66780.1 hypothetical protein SCANT_v1c08740 [Spiroplasma cantharicola]